MAAAMAISGTIGWLVVSSGAPVPVLLFWRCLFGALTLLAFCAALGLLRRLAWRMVMLAAVGGIAIVANWLLLFLSYSHASISVATVIYNTQPFMLVGLGVLFLREKVTMRQLGWLALAFGGVVLLARSKPQGAPVDAQYPLGVALALGAACLYAIAALVAKRLKGIAPHLIALIQMAVGTLLLLPVGVAAGWPDTLREWGSFVTIGAVYTGFMYILLYGALQKLPTPVAGALSFIYPLVAVLVDHLAFGVRLGVEQWAGAAAVLAAAGGLNLAPRAPAAAAHGSRS